MLVADRTLAVGTEIRGTASQDCLIAAGPLSKQPGTMPNRIVLVSVGGQFVVYREIFDTDGLPVGDVPEPSFFHSGNYFNADELVKAVEKFAQRVKDSAECLQSLYRTE